MTLTGSLDLSLIGFYYDDDGTGKVTLFYLEYTVTIFILYGPTGTQTFISESWNTPRPGVEANSTLLYETEFGKQERPLRILDQGSHVEGSGWIPFASTAGGFSGLAGGFGIRVNVPMYALFKASSYVVNLHYLR